MNTLRSLPNRLLRLGGLRLQRYSPHVKSAPKVHLWRYERVLQQFHNYLLQTTFSDLPENEKRLMLLGDLQGQAVPGAMLIVNTLHHALGVDGDVCEFGCAGGATSALIANEMRSTQKRLWLFDSFAGLPKPTEKDELIDDVAEKGSIEAYEGEMSFPITQVMGRLNAIGFPATQTEIVQGFIEKTIHSPRLPAKVCFALVDFDFYEPIHIALNFLADRMPVGGGIVVDDYGFFSSGAQKAVDEFVAEQAAYFRLEPVPTQLGHFALIRKFAAKLESE